MQKSEYIVDDLQNLSLDIYTIGYPGMGETILTMICEGNSVLFTTLTDCYLTSDCNYVSNILNQRGVSAIDAFIWTHPDVDHSVGICDVLSQFDSLHKAKVYLPEEFHNGIRYKVCNEAMDALSYLKENYSVRSDYNVCTVGVTENETRGLIRLRFKEKHGEKKIRCQWQFMAPFGELAWRQVSKDNFTLNDLSIVYSMHFNDVNFLFCGDLAERSVKFMDSQYLQNVYFIKIPHHGSCNDNRVFIRKLQENQVKGALSVTTSFQSTHPYPETLEAYKNISCEIDCTGDAAHTVEKYGCIKASFNICSLVHQTELSGNAFCYYRQMENHITDVLL